MKLKIKLISVLYKNVYIITIKYYLIDVEILFIRNPFMKKSTVDFNYVMKLKHIMLKKVIRKIL